MIGRTLARYFALAFARAVASVFAGLFVLIYLLDFVDLLRRAGDNTAATASQMAMLSFLRVPTVTEQVLPFVVLFGAMIAFIALTRRLELVVARAAGLSIWQFLAPAVGVALAFGVLASVAYNPVSAAFKQRADRIEATLFGSALSRPSAGLWLRQRGVDGEAILRADRLADDGVTAEGVTAFVFQPGGAFLERVSARTAVLHPGFWQFADARVISPDPAVAPRTDPTFVLPTNLQPERLTRAAEAPEDISFWALPRIAAETAEAGLDATPFRLRYQTLLARPLSLVSMVLVAAIFSLRFFRFGGVATMAMSGVAAGFLLYVATKLTSDLGGAGILNAGVAAWSPAVVGSMLATFVLLHQEDG